MPTRSTRYERVLIFFPPRKILISKKEKEKIKREREREREKAHFIRIGIRTQHRKCLIYKKDDGDEGDTATGTTGMF